MALLVNSFTSVTHRAFYTDRSGIFMRSGFIGIISFIKHLEGGSGSHMQEHPKSSTWESRGTVHTKSTTGKNQIHWAQLVPLCVLSRASQAVMFLLGQGQEEVTVSTCASSALAMPTKLCHLHYSELHTFCSWLIDQVSLWTVKKLQIMDLQFSALQLTRTRNNCWHVHNFILRTQQSQWQKQNHYFNTVSFPLGTDLHTVRSKSVLKQCLGGKHSKP